MSKSIDVLNEVNFKSFYTRHIPVFEPNGKLEVQCLCPFHDDKEPSLSVNLKKGVFKCFGCGEQGGVVKFIQLRYGLDKKDAIKKILAEEGIETDPASSSGEKTKSGTRNPKSAYLTLDQVKLIHSQLLKNETALKTFQGKYGLSLETIEKHFIGYQNEHYVIPIEIEPGKWTIKEHKGQQSKGAKVSLYPSNIIKEDLPFIIIGEGEFKVLLLNQMGFPSVSGTGGANTWKREWNTFFVNLNVVIAYDNDEPGRQGATKVVGLLKGIARSVKMIRWPSYMDSKDKKDVTDFFVTLGKTKDDFQRLIDHAEEMAYEIKEIAGIRFIEPAGFKVEENCVYQITYIREKVFEPKPVCYTPVFITQRAIDVDIGLEEVEITFRRDSKQKKIWVAKQVVSDMKKILELSNHGLPVNSRNAGRMIEYLAAFEAFNMQLIPKTFISKGFGFKSVEGKRVFILNKMVGKKAIQGSKEVSVEFSPEFGFERFVKAVKPEGTYLKWRECVEPALKYPYAGFAFYASFAAPLLRMLKSPNFLIDFWGHTSVGKTTVLELAASVWGNPHKEAGGLVFGWDSTRVFLERMANFFCDVPIFPDDSQTVDDRTMASMLYQVVNGTGKGRGSVVGIRQTPTWHTVCFSTGERPLTECTSFSGARARTISLYGSPFPNAGSDFINDLKTGLRENYGHAGVKLVEDILSIWDNPDKMTRLKADYKMYQRALSLESNSEVGDRYSQYFAVVKLAADLVHEILGIGDPVAARESIDRVFDNVISESMSDMDIGTRAMQYVLSWASGNEQYFKNTDYESYGQWKEGEYIGVYPHKLAEVLRSEKFSERAILKSWAEKGWLKCEGGKFTCSRNVRIEDGIIKQRRLTIIPWQVVKEFSDI